MAAAEKRAIRRKWLQAIGRCSPEQNPSNMPPPLSVSIYTSIYLVPRERELRDSPPPVLYRNNELSLEPEPDAIFSRAPIRSITQPCPITPLSMFDRSARRPNERVVLTGAMPRATRE